MFRHPPIAVLLAIYSISPAAEPPLPSGNPAGRVECVRRIDLHDFGGIVYCYQKDGTELWHTPPQGGLTIASTIDGWTGQPHRSFVLLYRRADPRVYNASFYVGWQ